MPSFLTAIPLILASVTAPAATDTLDDGTLAVGLFNKGFDRVEITVRWADLGLSGPRPRPGSPP